MKFFTGKKVFYKGATYDDVRALTLADAETVYIHGGRVYKVGDNLLDGNIKSIKLLAEEMVEVPMAWKPH